MKSIKISLDEKELILNATGQKSLLDFLIENKIEINHSCGGHGTCGTCRIFIQSDLKSLPSPNEIEQEMIQERGFNVQERLSCQLCPLEGLKITIT